MADVDEFLISDFKTAKYLEKDRWLALPDAFPVLEDAVVEKGIIKRRNGTSEFGVPLSVTEPSALSLNQTTAISSVTDLQNMANDLAGEYYLTQDIDASGVSFTPVGTSGSPFTGTFDGNGYRITGLTITAGTTTNVGLFGSIRAATLYNFTIEDSNIFGDGVVGACVGLAQSGSGNNVIQNVTVANTIVRGGAKIGGLVGQFTEGSITRCTTTEMIIRHVTGESYSNIGLFAGQLGLATYTTCFAHGTIEQAQSGVGTTIGGFVGTIANDAAAFVNCDVSGVMPWSMYSAAVINTGAYGGFAGNTDGNGDFTNCFFLNTLQPFSHGGVDEKQQIGFVGADPTGGTYTITFDGQTTDPIAYNATAAQIQTEIDSTFGYWNSDDTRTRNIEVENTPLSTMFLYFRGDYSRADQALATLDGTLLTGGAAPHTPLFVETNAGSYTAPGNPPTARDNGDTIEPTAIVGMNKIAYQGYNTVIVCSKRNIYEMHQDAVFDEITGANIFTGGDDDYFWFEQYNDKLYMCNGVDAIVVYTPDQAEPNNVVAMSTGSVTIQTARILLKYKDRLLMIGTRVGDIWYPRRLYYTDVLLDTVAATNWVDCPDDITPISAGYIGQVPVIFCLDGTIWHIDFTNNTDAPFKWTRKQKFHGSRARMGTAEVNSRLSTPALTRMITYDGHVARDFDQRIRGFYDDCNIQKLINTYAHRMLDRNYVGWCYTRSAYTDHDRILMYNMDDANFSDFAIAGHCLFSAKGQWLPQGTPPGNYYYPIRDQDFQEYEFVGTKDGRILQMNTGYQDEGVNIVGDIQSAQLNPYQKEGLRCRLFYVKFLLSGPDGEGLTVNFYKNDSATAFKTAEVNSSGTTKNWQCIHCDNEVGDFFRFMIQYQYESGVNASDDFKIFALLFGAKRGERIENRYEYTS
jgi:hypothetical protein